MNVRRFSILSFNEIEDLLLELLANTHSKSFLIIGHCVILGVNLECRNKAPSGPIFLCSQRSVALHLSKGHTGTEVMLHPLWARQVLSYR